MSFLEEGQTSKKGIKENIHYLTITESGYYKNMVLILSNNFDPSTSDVISWLDYLGVKWFRINESDRIRLLNIEFDKNETSNIPPQRQKVYRLVKLEGYCYKEVGEMLSIAPSTTISHIA